MINLDEKKNDFIIWIDIETTGLDVEKDKILEISCIITDNELNIKHLLKSLVIHCEDKILENMGDWCKQTHQQSRLIEECKNSKLNIVEAEVILLNFLKTNTNPKCCPLAGNSVHFDRKFLEKYMKNVIEHVHYKNIDVSIFYEITKRKWLPGVVFKKFKKSYNHRAYSDICESIQEMNYYICLFKKYINQNIF